MSKYNAEASKLEYRASLYREVAKLEGMLWIMHPGSGPCSAYIEALGNRLEIKELREKHPTIAAAMEAEIKAKMTEIKDRILLIESKDGAANG
jgi:hypothetical protein